MIETFHPMPFGHVRLLPGLFLSRANLNRQYMLSLKTENLLQNFYMEAGLWNPAQKPECCHWGWESPTSQLRGHFLGHWLSAAAMYAANTADAEVKGKADYIVNELALCQKENGGEWIGSIPEKYLDWAARGKSVWAPHYTLHKTGMGLYDMYAFTGNHQALEILVRWAHWFHRWTGQFTQEQMDHILDYETGGMLEVWANLYGITGEKDHYDLLHRYYRRRLFDPIAQGKDMLTNMHANTTIPEIQGAARAWEVTGEDVWRSIVENYWQSAVEERGMYVTGGQTNGEIWSPKNQLYSRLGSRTQEHCTVYNMMRLSEYLLRWTGKPVFADYWERNLYNGVLAQQHPDTGMISYWLPLNSGAVKIWGTPTEDFWCCHGTLVQAHTIYPNHIYYQAENGLVLSQWIPSKLTWQHGESSIEVRLEEDHQLSEAHHPDNLAYDLFISCDQPCEFSIHLRLPWWISDTPEILVNGEKQPEKNQPSSYYEIHRVWSRNDQVKIKLPKRITAVPLPDEPNTCAFMDGPIVLAGLNPGGDSLERTLNPVSISHRRPHGYPIDGLTLVGDARQPQTLLAPENEREWEFWKNTYQTRGQYRNIRFIPLFDVRDEIYTVYFPIKG